MSYIYVKNDGDVFSSLLCIVTYIASINTKPRVILLQNTRYKLSKSCCVL